MRRTIRYLPAVFSLSLGAKSRDCVASCSDHDRKLVNSATDYQPTFIVALARIFHESVDPVGLAVA
jgi:hypothetical protein